MRDFSTVVKWKTSETATGNGSKNSRKKKVAESRLQIQTHHALKEAANHTDSFGRTSMLILARFKPMHATANL